MQAFIEEVLRYINTATDEKHNFLNIRQWHALIEMDLATNIADFKL